MAQKGADVAVVPKRPPKWSSQSLPITLRPAFRGHLIHARYRPDSYMFEIGDDAVERTQHGLFPAKDAAISAASCTNPPRGPRPSVSRPEPRGRERHYSSSAAVGSTGNSPLHLLATIREDAQCPVRRKRGSGSNCIDRSIHSKAPCACPEWIKVGPCWSAHTCRSGLTPPRADNGSPRDRVALPERTIPSKPGPVVVRIEANPRSPAQPSWRRRRPGRIQKSNM
jgi:hypothetical protein